MHGIRFLAAAERRFNSTDSLCGVRFWRWKSSNKREEIFFDFLVTAAMHANSIHYHHGNRGTLSKANHIGKRLYEHELRIWPAAHTIN